MVLDEADAPQDDDEKSNEQMEEEETRYLNKRAEYYLSQPPERLRAACHKYLEAKSHTQKGGFKGGHEEYCKKGNGRGDTKQMSKWNAFVTSFEQRKNGKGGTRATGIEPNAIATAPTSASTSSTRSTARAQETPAPAARGPRAVQEQFDWLDPPQAAREPTTLYNVSRNSQLLAGAMPALSRKPDASPAIQDGDDRIRGPDGSRGLPLKELAALYGCTLMPKYKRLKSWEDLAKKKRSEDKTIADSSRTRSESEMQGIVVQHKMYLGADRPADLLAQRCLALPQMAELLGPGVTNLGSAADAPWLSASNEADQDVDGVFRDVGGMDRKARLKSARNIFWLLQQQKLEERQAASRTTGTETISSKDLSDQNRRLKKMKAFHEWHETALKRNFRLEVEEYAAWASVDSRGDYTVYLLAEFQRQAHRWMRAISAYRSVSFSAVTELLEMRHTSSEDARADVNAVRQGPISGKAAQLVEFQKFIAKQLMAGAGGAAENGTTSAANRGGAPAGAMAGLRSAEYTHKVQGLDWFMHKFEADMYDQHGHALQAPTILAPLRMLNLKDRKSRLALADHMQFLSENGVAPPIAELEPAVSGAGDVKRFRFFVEFRLHDCGECGDWSPPSLYEADLLREDSPFLHAVAEAVQRLLPRGFESKGDKKDPLSLSKPHVCIVLCASGVDFSDPRKDPRQKTRLLRIRLVFPELVMTDKTKADQMRNFVVNALIGHKKAEEDDVSKLENNLPMDRHIEPTGAATTASKKKGCRLIQKYSRWSSIIGLQAKMKKATNKDAFAMFSECVMPNCEDNRNPYPDSSAAGGRRERELLFGDAFSSSGTYGASRAGGAGRDEKENVRSPSGIPMRLDPHCAVLELRRSFCVTKDADAQRQQNELHPPRTHVKILTQKEGANLLERKGFFVSGVEGLSYDWQSSSSICGNGTPLSTSKFSVDENWRGPVRGSSGVVKPGDEDLSDMVKLPREELEKQLQRQERRRTGGGS
ncbi:unnamed protein product [Amoebophrya sp. A25]|nr:unnamed protein product [Amoebophrya sp. A25]|eukprot:GSA25T00003486001.1